MSQIREIEIFRKISQFSVLSAKYDEKRKSLSVSAQGPKDTFYIVHITSFLLGFMNLMPLMFFAVASNYWMYKFRDTTTNSTTTTGADRTDLQSYFISLSMIAQTIPNILFSVFSLYTKISEVNRTIWSLSGLGAVFALFSLFTKINTDIWQAEFFIFTLVLMILNSSFLTILAMSTLVLMAKLPTDYLYYFMLGQNGTLMTTIFAIISLAVTESVVTSGLIYFLTGTILIAITLIMFLLTRQSKVFTYYDIQISPNEEKSTTMTLSDMKSLSKKIWPSMVLFTLCTFNIITVYPSIQTLVVSENEGDGTAWSKKYFVPVTVFLLFDVFGTVGKISSRTLKITVSNKWWYIIGSSLISLMFIPFYMLCNAQPRTLPVIFKHDWEFVTMNIFFAFIAGSMLNISFMSLKTLSNNEEEKSFLLMNMWYAVLTTVFCANGLLAVKFL